MQVTFTRTRGYLCVQAGRPQGTDYGCKIHRWGFPKYSHLAKTPLCTQSHRTLKLLGSVLSAEHAEYNRHKKHKRNFLLKNAELLGRLSSVLKSTHFNSARTRMLHVA
jgi:hypothetical protein